MSKPWIPNKNLQKAELTLALEEQRVWGRRWLEEHELGEVSEETREHYLEAKRFAAEIKSNWIEPPPIPEELLKRFYSIPGPEDIP
jgi:hypothetical protein